MCARPALQQPSRKTHWSRHTCCSVSLLWFFPLSQVGRWPRLRPAACCVFPLARSASAILGWSPRSSVVLVVSHAIALCAFPQILVIACVFPQSIVIASVFPQSLVNALYFFLVSVVSRIKLSLHCFLVLSVCVIEILGHVERMTGENKRDHNAASLFEFVFYSGAMNDWCDRAQSALP